MIEKNLTHIRQTIRQIAEKCGRDPADIKLVAVSKRFPVEAIHEARAAGQVLFGENYLQEAADKKPQLPDGVRLHFIGNLQSNKAKTAAELFDMIETVDRYKIAAALNRHLLEIDRSLDILLQVNIGEDPKKHGLQPEQAAALLEQIKELKQLRVRGLMTMPPFTDNPEDARPHFRELRLLSEQLQAENLLDRKQSTELSMGMSGDFHIAIEEGATIIRVGTAIFGARPPVSSQQPEKGSSR